MRMQEDEESTKRNANEGKSPGPSAGVDTEPERLLFLSLNMTIENGKRARFLGLEAKYFHSASSMIQMPLKSPGIHTP